MLASSRLSTQSLGSLLESQILLPQGRPAVPAVPHKRLPVRRWETMLRGGIYASCLDPEAVLPARCAISSLQFAILMPMDWCAIDVCRTMTICVVNVINATQTGCVVDGFATRVAWPSSFHSCYCETQQLPDQEQETHDIQRHNLAVACSSMPQTCPTAIPLNS